MGRGEGLLVGRAVMRDNPMLTEAEVSKARRKISQGDLLTTYQMLKRFSPVPAKGENEQVDKLIEALSENTLESLYRRVSSTPPVSTHPEYITLAHRFDAKARSGALPDEQFEMSEAFHSPAAGPIVKHLLNTLPSHLWMIQAPELRQAMQLAQADNLWQRLLDAYKKGLEKEIEKRVGGVLITLSAESYSKLSALHREGKEFIMHVRSSEYSPEAQCGMKLKSASPTVKGAWWQTENTCLNCDPPPGESEGMVLASDPQEAAQIRDEAIEKIMKLIKDGSDSETAISACAQELVEKSVLERFEKGEFDPRVAYMAPYEAEEITEFSKENVREWMRLHLTQGQNSSRAYLLSLS